MANNNAPFGFAESHRLGAAVNYQISRRWINASNPTPIYFGDPVIMTPGTAGTGGYIQQAPSSPGTLPIAGIFIGCEYTSVSQKKWFSSNYWPATGDVATPLTGFDVAAKIIDDPMMVFRVQANGWCQPFMVGMNAQYSLGSTPGGGRSGATIDVVTNAPAATATFPFRIVDLIRDPPGGATTNVGSDATSPYNWVYVTFNNQDYGRQQPGHA
jgi:hypothetical protein